MTERTVKELLTLLEHQQEDIASVVSEMEETHTEAELAANGNFCALASAGLGIAEMRETMKRWINRGGAAAEKDDK